MPFSSGDSRKSLSDLAKEGDLVGTLRADPGYPAFPQPTPPKKQPSRRKWWILGIVVGVILLAVIITLVVKVNSTKQSQPPQVAQSEGDSPITLVRIIDGDTVETSVGTVRLIGVDTPERGECGYAQAIESAGDVVATGDTLTLVLPEGTDDEDKHGRLLRYVETQDGVDLGLAQLEAGMATPRYDSTDGYAKHPREDQYRATGGARLTEDGSVIIPFCEGAEDKTSEELYGELWWEDYRSCTHLKKNTVGHPKGPFDRDDPEEAEIYKWFTEGTGHDGDGDKNGLACE